MQLDRQWIEALIFGDEIGRRFTQDSPVLPDVWLGYAQAPNEPLDLLLTPHRDATAGALGRVLLERLDKDAAASRLAYNQSTVVVCLSFKQLIRQALPLTPWWRKYVMRQRQPGYLHSVLNTLADSQLLEQIFRPTGTFTDTGLAAPTQPPVPPRGEPAPSTLVNQELGLPSELVWMIRLIGTVALAQKNPIRTRRTTATPKQRQDAWNKMQQQPAAIVAAASELLDGLDSAAEFERTGPDQVVLWSVSRNRAAAVSVWRSTQAVKADAAARLFNVSCSDLTWAVIDSGIDARHLAFRSRSHTSEPGNSGSASGGFYEEPFELDKRGRWQNRTRIKATYDFTVIRDLLSMAVVSPVLRDAGETAQSEGAQRTGKTGSEKMSEMRERVRNDRELRELLKHLNWSLQRGQEVDWSALKPFIEVPHTDAYRPPSHEHGTHVAGILAADWDPNHFTASDGGIVRGVCPDINLYDLRVLNDAGEGDEFSVMAALQFVRYLNAHKDSVSVHGVNLSLSIPHDVANYACGRTPVCEECERLVGAGTVVVAAAGNKGYQQYLTSRGEVYEGYSSISITDPGNADGVITVGSTHRYMPHNYGVSYFSSRGPTGDGRLKPDLVAPGEKIEAPVPEGKLRRLDGTSMAAPHVSGAAALLMARHRELAGSPVRIKRILCQTATDLGRERYFQGHGMVDILRALQSV